MAASSSSQAPPQSRTMYWLQQLGIVVFAVVATIVATNYNNYSGVSWLADYYMSGVVHAVEKVALCQQPFHVDRSEEKKALTSLLSSSPDEVGYYLLIIGRHGCGKTCLVKETLREIMADNKGGAIYVPVPENAEKFTHQFRIIFANRASYPAALLDALFGVAVFPESIKDLEAFFRDYLCHHADTYAKQNQRRLIIVFDGIHHLLRNHVGDLESLQRMAKLIADDCKILLVFIDSGTSVRDVFVQQSASSRMEIHEIGDVTQKHAIDILNFRNPYKLNSTELYSKVTGGRLKLLWSVGLALKSSSSEGTTVKDIVEMYLQEIEAKISECYSNCKVEKSVGFNT